MRLCGMMRVKTIFVMALAGLLLTCAGCDQKKDNDLKLLSALNPSRDFILLDQEGRVFRLSEHRGEVLLLFFGYLTCPDVCPTTLSKLARVYTLLGTKRQKVKTLFVSVDPKRDTPAKMKEYLDYFDIKALGLSGSQPQIDQVVKAYGAYYEQVNTTSSLGYLINHTDYVYLIDSQGQVRHLFHPQDKAQDMAALIERLL
ncbi:MAG: SCO family protein [Candidatus Omnitrophica bacterium]|nr:SCO family protein [Candidatus Omnitrophota bacterium]